MRRITPMPSDLARELRDAPEWTAVVREVHVRLERSS
jgi:hypothetical protein